MFNDNFVVVNDNFVKLLNSVIIKHAESVEVNSKSDTRNSRCGSFAFLVLHLA